MSVELRWGEEERLPNKQLEQMMMIIIIGIITTMVMMMMMF